MKNITNEPIDIFLPWVDDSDEVWRKEKDYYAEKLEDSRRSSNSSVRFESWDNLHYLFRGIEECMPWVRKIFFVTYGHIPSFLNINHPKIEIVNHKDYIPSEYLPTYNASTIEMNAHRIKGMSENFILFNDDCFPLQYMKPEYFFKNNQVCDEAIERIIAPTPRNNNIAQTMTHIYVNDMFVINKYFKKREVQKKHFFKWYNIKYGKMLMRTISLHHYYDFDNFSNPHMPHSMKKSTFEKVWKVEPKTLDIASRNRFRNYTDLNQYVVRYWQLCEGDFYPRRSKGKYYSVSENNYKKIADDIKHSKHNMICLNENNELDNWEDIKQEINRSFEARFPNKSSFER
ncbi:glycosyltransferase [Lachnospiraceae bacterium KM106-2]|nr:glycosyltransferase [Lachnospiraceae bacterium KM106-2]